MIDAKRTPTEFNTRVFPTWCPGCGDFGIWGALKQALINQNLEPHSIVIVYGIGCSSNMANFVNTYAFHGLHGRPVPVAEGVKMANHGLPVIAVSGDGDAYGEGLNHFMHAMRANQDITYIVHNNQIYSLTTGQASPTTEQGTETKSTPTGLIEVPINPVGLGVTVGASFVARGFAGYIDHLAGLIEQAMKHKGFSLVDVLQPCITFNHVNTHAFFRKRVVKLEEQGHDPTNAEQAWKRSREWGKTIPIGVFYTNDRKSYQENLPQLAQTPLVGQPIDDIDISPLCDTYR